MQSFICEVESHSGSDRASAKTLRPPSPSKKQGDGGSEASDTNAFNATSEKAATASAASSDRGTSTGGGTTAAGSPNKTQLRAATSPALGRNGNDKSVFPKAAKRSASGTSSIGSGHSAGRPGSAASSQAGGGPPKGRPASAVSSSSRASASAGGGGGPQQEQGTVGGVPVLGAAYPVFEQKISEDPENPGQILFTRVENWDYMRKAVAASHTDYVSSQSWAQTDVFGWTILHFAADGNSEAVFHLLKDTSADLKFYPANATQIPKDKWTTPEKSPNSLWEALLERPERDLQKPLHVAARANAKEVAQLLLSARANPGGRDFNLFTPLIAASIHGNDVTVEALARVCSKALVDAADKDGRTAIHWGTIHGHVETCKLLICNAASLNKEDNFGRTPVQAAQDHREQLIVVREVHALNLEMLEAAKNRETAIVRECLAKGAQLDAVDDDGWSALVWAALNRKIDLLQLLIAKGASVYMRDHVGKTAADYAAQMGDNAKVLEQLFECNKGLYHAAETRHPVVPFLELKAYPEYVAEHNFSKWTPLMWAAFNADKSAAAVLIDAKADPTRQDLHGEDPRFHCCRGGQNGFLAAVNGNANPALEQEAREIFEQLLKVNPKGVSSLDEPNLDGETVLHIAVENNKPLLVDCILSQDIRLMQTVYPRSTILPFTRACMKGYGEVVKVFLRFFCETTEVPLHDPSSDEYSSVPPSEPVTASLASSNPYAAPIRERMPPEIAAQHAAFRAADYYRSTAGSQSYGAPSGLEDGESSLLLSDQELVAAGQFQVEHGSVGVNSTTAARGPAKSNAQKGPASPRGVTFADPAKRLKNNSWLTADTFEPGDILLKNVQHGGFWKMKEGGSVMPTVPGHFVEISVGRNLHDEVGRRLGETEGGAGKRILQLHRPDCETEILSSGAMVISRSQWSALKVSYRNAVLEYANGRLAFSTAGELLQMMNSYPRVQNEQQFAQARREIEPGCILYFENAPASGAEVEQQTSAMKQPANKPPVPLRSDEEEDGVAVGAGETYLFCEDFVRLAETDRILVFEAASSATETTVTALEQQMEDRPFSYGSLDLAAHSWNLRNAVLESQKLDDYLTPFVADVRCLALTEDALPNPPPEALLPPPEVAREEGNNGSPARDQKEVPSAAQPSAEPAAPTGTHDDAAAASSPDDINASPEDHSGTDGDKKKKPVDLRLTERASLASRWVEKYPTPKSKRTKRIPVFNSLEGHHEPGELSPLHLVIQAGCVAGLIAILNHKFEFAYRRLLVYLAPNLLVLAAQAGSWDCTKFLLESDVKPAWQFERCWQAVLKRAQREATVRKFPSVAKLLQPFAYLPERNLEYRCYLYGFPRGLDEDQFRDWLDDHLMDIKGSSYAQNHEYHCGPMAEHLYNVEEKAAFWLTTRDWETFCSVLDVSGENYTYRKPLTDFARERMSRMVMHMEKEDAAGERRSKNTICVMACYHSEFVAQYLSAVYRVRKQGDSPKKSRGMSPTGKQRRLRALGPFLGGEQVRSEDY
ncbi:unnamed protein product [Amoebophrya sp. A120]|nr:unnamed protein product [Amoebophrya sp. A120]|eukprot:GSA120T00005239001.1